MRNWSIWNNYRKSLLSVFLIGMFVLSLFSVDWSSDLVHAGGLEIIKEILFAMLTPDLSASILTIALKSTFITLAYAVAGMTLAIIIAFFLGILASGILFPTNRFFSVLKKVFRGLLGFLRAIHELVWAWLFVASFGLSPFAAIFALAIPYGGILGRIFADMLADVDQRPIEALRSSGASKWQTIFYGYIPIVGTNILSYTMYRFECALRSSAIMSFVGLGGLGYQIQLSINDFNYSEVWTYLYFLIILVVLVDWFSVHLRNKLNGPTKSKFVPWATVGIFALIIASWCYVYLVDKARLLDLFSERNWQYAKKFFSNMFGIGVENPAYLNWDTWKNALGLTYETLQMSIMAIGFSAIVMFLTIMFATKSIANGRLTMSNKWYNWIFYYFLRFCYIISRAVPELVWAMLIVFILKPGILPGAICLALHNFGILGKLCAEVIDDLDERPIKNLVSSGASRWQILMYGVMPSVMPRFLTYILYRWEVIMKTTIVVGFVGAGGLGKEFKLSMSFFHYTDLTVLLICYVALVWMADYISERARKIVK